MTPERWQRIESLVEAALQLETGDRRRFLDVECGDDDELKRRAAAMLRSYGQAESFLERPAALGWLAEGEGAMAESSTTIARPGDLEAIGPYRILDEIGRGGMGSVFLAARRDGEYERRVAIKLIRPEVGSEDVARRFRGERQILANLDHPNIAKLLDGGTTDDGRPYVVMELIEGTRIDTYCDRQRATIRHRLDLFADVCSAVAYAHRCLVVHRDLKPANILVTEEGVPKLLDFGIAKLLDPSAFPHTVEATASGPGPMTPPYASPEQILGQPITTASDVYSLGVLLYKLLTGRMPFDPAGRPPRQILEDLAREPIHPSAAVTLPAEASAAGAEEILRTSTERGLSPYQLRRRLAGDLDNIVLKALRREPERRYGSVEQLAADLRRHLDGLPVLARKASLRYRAGKFLRRYRLGVAAASVILALVVGSAVQITRQRDLAERERDRAKQVSDALVDLFENIDPDEATSSRVTAREILDRGAEDIAIELKDHPRTQAAVKTAIGKVYRNLGLYEQAQPLLEDALDQRRKILGEEHLEVAESLYELAVLLANLGDSRAKDLHRRALDIRRRLLGSSHLAVAQSLSGNGEYAILSGRITQGISYLQQELIITKEVVGSDHIETAKALENLAAAHQHAANSRAAEPLLQQALDILESSLGEDHPRLTGILALLTWFHCEIGRYSSGENLGLRAARIVEKHFGPENPEICDTFSSLAYCYANQGDLEKADELLTRNADISRKNFGDASAPFSTDLHNLAIIKFRKKEYGQAEDLLRRSLDISNAIELGHRSLLPTLIFLGRVHEQREGFDAAITHYQRSLSISEELISAGEHDERLTATRATSLCELGDVYRKQGDLERAADYYTKALSIFELIESIQMPSILFTQARALTYMGRTEEAKLIADELHARGWTTPEFVKLSREHGYGPRDDSSTPGGL